MMQIEWIRVRVYMRGRTLYRSEAVSNQLCQCSQDPFLEPCYLGQHALKD